MSLAKALVLVVSFLGTTAAFAVRYQFSDLGNKSAVSSRSISERSGGLASQEIRLSIAGIDVERNAEGFDTLKIEGLSPTTQVGLPEVPVTGSLVAVPPGYQVHATVVSSNFREIRDVFVKPAQKKMRCDCGPEAFQFNSRLYKSDTAFPSSLLKVEDVGKVGGVSLVRIGLQPVQFNPSAREIKVVTDAVVRVSFEKVSNAPAAVLPKTLARLVRQTTINGQDAISLVGTNASPEVMLILVADSLKSEIAPFVAWKNAKGIQTEVVTFTDAGATKEKVQATIKKYYDSHTVKPTYLLFVGNKATMPAFMEDTGSGSAASDYRFSLLAGDDDIPDVFYGRFLANNAQELKIQMQRSIDYEKAPEKKAEWYHDATTIASNEGSSPSDKDYALMVQDALKKGTYKNADSFFQGDMNATSKNITEALEKGRTWIAYFGHGSGTSWGSTNDSFSNSTVKKLKNGGKLPIIVDVACLNSSWVNIEEPFAKAWVTQQADGKDAGAVAFYGGSVNISWDPPAVMSVGIAKSHFEQNLNTLGSSLLAGQLYLIKEMGTGNDTLDNVKWYNLFGDPSLVLRTDTPREFKVKKNIAQEGERAVLHIETTDLVGAPMAGLTVAITPPNYAGTLVGKTNANGVADITLTGISATGAGTKLVVSGYNADTYETTLE